MGPRPRGRGILPMLRSNRLDNSGFNGAATARSRNFGEFGECCGYVYLLQWGRDRAVAELSHYAAVLELHSALQWGRDRAVAELQTPPTSSRA